MQRNYRRVTVAAMRLSEEIFFLMTNRVPRRWLTLFMGWLSPIENVLVSSVCIGLWKRFSDLDLSESRKQRFASLQECFTRELRPDARPIDEDPAVLVSPCDGIVGAHGRVEEGMVLQAKGLPYRLADLLSDAKLAEEYRDGCYVTLRLTPTMYHRFHASCDLRVEHVTYISGDTWNVHPIALKRLRNLFCRNERAVLKCRMTGNGALLTLVPVAAILVASIRLRFLDVLLHLRYRGPNHIACQATLRKGEEMGWFQHGSTIIVFAPAGVRLAPHIHEGLRIRMGEALMHL